MSRVVADNVEASHSGWRVAADVDGSHPPPRRALVALCVTQVTSWGVLYYAFPVALASITADTRWSASAATGLRLVPRRWLIAGVAMAAVFYQAAFAALTHWYGDRRVWALTALTLVAGLSSTIFAPLTSALLEHLSWRHTYLALAAVLAVVTVPLHAFVLTPPWTPPPPHPRPADGATEHGRRRAVPPEVRTTDFLLLSAALTRTAFGLYAASITVIPLLTGRGFTASLAATTLGLLGAGQLLGRIGFAPLSARTSPTSRTVIIVAASAVTVAVLGALTGPPALLIAAAIAVGAARGAGTLLQATVVADRWGTARYGTLSGFFAAPITAATAIAPWGGTVLAEATGSYPAAFLILAALIALAASAAALVRPARS